MMNKYVCGSELIISSFLQGCANIMNPSSFLFFSFFKSKYVTFLNVRLWLLIRKSYQVRSIIVVWREKPSHYINCKTKGWQKKMPVQSSWMNETRKFDWFTKIHFNSNIDGTYLFIFIQMSICLKSPTVKSWCFSIMSPDGWFFVLRLHILNFIRNQNRFVIRAQPCIDMLCMCV